MNENARYPNLMLDADEQLLLMSTPSLVYTFYAWLLKTWALIVSAGVLLFMLNLQGVKNLIGTSQTIEHYKWIAVSIFLIFLLLVFLGLRYIHGCFRFYFTDKRCIYDFQFLSHDQKTVPYSRIFNMEIKQNTCQYFLKIADVLINAQNISSPDLNASYFPLLFGLSKENAQQVNQIITSRVPRD